MRVALLGLWLFLSPLARAQTSPIDPAAIPIEQEPRHRLVFVNEFVRIIDAAFPPLYVSQNHTHTLDNVAITIVPGIEGPRAPARIGFAGFSRGGYSHVITNPNPSPMRFIAVELRAADRGAAEEEPQADHVTVLSNAKVRISRVRLGAGGKVPSHRHAAGYVSVVVRGGEGPGVWKRHGAAEAPASLEAGRQPLEIVEVEPR
jgi:hypothetical protein